MLLKELTIALVPGIPCAWQGYRARRTRPNRGCQRHRVPTDRCARHLRSDKNGEYSLADLPAGSIKIRVDAKDYVPAERVVQVQEPSNRDRIQEIDPINLEDAGEVQGEVVDERGDPVVGARVAKETLSRPGCPWDRCLLAWLPPAPTGSLPWEGCRKARLPSRRS